jgi:hypothetical protein
LGVVVGHPDEPGHANICIGTEQEIAEGLTIAIEA